MPSDQIDSLSQKIFAQEAADFFKNHPHSTVHVDGDLGVGKLLAIRYGDDVLVVKLDDSHAPTIYKSLFGAS